MAPSPKNDNPMTLERLQKFLSRAGVASRRQAEALILEGKVKVNGRVVTEMGVKIDPDKDRVQVEGKRVRLPSAPVTFMLHKPYGYISTTDDPQGRRTVMDLAPQEHGRLYPVGRLDYDATGLMLLTNDGELAQRLTHPRYQVPRTYRVTVDGGTATLNVVLTLKTQTLSLPSVVTSGSTQLRPIDDFLNIAF